MSKGNRQNGFTLIEVLIAITLLAIGILAAGTMQISSLGGNHLATSITTSSTLAGSVIEELVDLDFEHPLLADTTGGGIDFSTADHDQLNQAVNDALNDHTTAHSSTDFDAPHYTIFWNVVDHYPYYNGEDDQPVVKTIRVTVRRDDNGVQRDQSLDFVKADYEWD